MIFCCYGRKSVYSDRSDSVDNQFRMCRDYVNVKYAGQVDDFRAYSDEDFTGANTNRPDLQRLLEDIRSGGADVLIVYQLDRLSRDVRDFANIYATLEEHRVKFVSIKENIDTSTPIGRAMMYVTVVFAQMERETIAARVTDNMIGLAKKGYWVGGNPPVGYVRDRIIVDGKKHCAITPDPEGAKYVTWIFDSFIQFGGSIQKMETQFKHKGIRTQRGGFFSASQLHKILTMPYCVEATPEVYDFYQAKGCIMDPGSPREKWDGSVGVMVYGRTTEKNKKHELQPPDQWRVCLGVHKPFMPADKWLAVQARFAQNQRFKTARWPSPLLKGVIRCKCGALMSIGRKQKVDGSVSSAYYCPKRIRQGADACDMRQIKCDILDAKVINILRAVEQDNTAILRYVQKDQDTTAGPDPKKISGQIKSCEAKIEKLAASLALASGSAATKYIIAEMERLDLEIQALNREYTIAASEERKRSAAQVSTQERAKIISEKMRNFDGFTAAERNAIAREVIKKCVWDGETLYVEL